MGQIWRFQSMGQINYAFNLWVNSPTVGPEGAAEKPGVVDPVPEGERRPRRLALGAAAQIRCICEKQSFETGFSRYSFKG
jgi:hypothetical protein